MPHGGRSRHRLTGPGNESPFSDYSSLSSGNHPSSVKSDTEVVLKRAIRALEPIYADPLVVADLEYDSPTPAHASYERNETLLSKHLPDSNNQEHYPQENNKTLPRISSTERTHLPYNDADERTHDDRTNHSFNDQNLRLQTLNNFLDDVSVSKMNSGGLKISEKTNAPRQHNNINTPRTSDEISNYKSTSDLSTLNNIPNKKKV